MANTPDKHRDILVDPARYELDATWVKKASVWARVVERLLRGVRRQPAAIGISAIVVLVWITGARAQDAGLLIAAFGSIVGITVAAEFIDGKTSEQYRGQGEAQSGHASSHQKAD